MAELVAYYEWYQNAQEVFETANEMIY